MQIKERLLAASAYLFGIPALYIVLTERRKKKFIGNHGAQALVIWIFFFLIFFTLRFGLNYLLAIQYIPEAEMAEPIFSILMGTYALICAVRSLAGKDFKFPHFNNV